ncbi:MAG: hypothetical protein GY832_15470 [Chloroflexi bacterium]|nr:hypothetical protein [Chloroflexota bacterium]
MNWDEATPVLLGAVLAVATTFVTKLFAEWHEHRTKRSRLERFLKVELPNCISRIDSLLRIYERSQAPDPDFLLALEHTVSRFAKHREVAYFLNAKMSQQVLEFYDGVDHAVEMILSMLRLAQETEYEGYASKEIQKQMLGLKKVYSVGKSLIEESNRKTPRWLNR